MEPDGFMSVGDKKQIKQMKQANQEGMTMIQINSEATMKLERLLKGLDGVLEQHGLTGVTVGSTIVYCVAGIQNVYSTFSVKGIRYIRDDWTSVDGVPYIQLAGEYFGVGGVQMGYMILNQNGDASLRMYEGSELLASSKKAQLVVSETLLVS